MASDSPPRILNERYRLDAKIGEGGMGVVYRGFDLVIERPIAVKILRLEGSTEEETQRFLREVRVTANIDNAHTVKLFDVGHASDGAPFLVMNLVEGESLRALLDRVTRISVERAVHMGLQACDALSAAHARGIVHRDVKPANLMVSRDGQDGADFITVLDFGVAKNITQKTSLTGPGFLVGTLEYMAPEQIAGEAIDGRVDQYSLAATILRMISGEALFPGVGVASLVHHQLTKVPATLCARVPLAPRALDLVLRRALEKDPSARYSSISAFASALRESLQQNEDTIRAPTPSLTLQTTPSLASFGEPTELELAPEAEMHLELDLPSAPLARTAESQIAQTAPRVRPEIIDDPAPAQKSLALLSPAVWKRVLGYSALVLLLGNACTSGFSRTSTALLVIGVLLGASALLVNAWLTRTRQSS